MLIHYLREIKKLLKDAIGLAGAKMVRYEENRDKWKKWYLIKMELEDLLDYYFLIEKHIAIYTGIADRIIKEYGEDIWRRMKEYI